MILLGFDNTNVSIILVLTIKSKVSEIFEKFPTFNKLAS